ncbi:MAG: hypothetical protein ABSD61_06450 [Terracidiphilus sp.]|jgi:hypothetical protein
MPGGFTIGAAMGEPTIFECPNCKETIDATAETCRFCGAVVDREAARKAAALMAKVNQACSDSSYMKSTALTLPVFFILRFVPFISAMGGIGFWVLLIAIPLWSLRWLLKYRGIVTDDAEFRKARSTVKWIGIIVATILAIFVAINILVFVMIRSSR